MQYKMPQPTPEEANLDKIIQKAYQEFCKQHPELKMPESPDKKMVEQLKQGLKGNKLLNDKGKLNHTLQNVFMLHAKMNHVPGKAFGHIKDNLVSFLLQPGNDFLQKPHPEFSKLKIALKELIDHLKDKKLIKENQKKEFDELFQLKPDKEEPDQPLVNNESFSKLFKALLLVFTPAKDTNGESFTPVDAPVLDARGSGEAGDTDPRNDTLVDVSKSLLEVMNVVSNMAPSIDAPSENEEAAPPRSPFQKSWPPKLTPEK